MSAQPDDADFAQLRAQPVPAAPLADAAAPPLPQDDRSRADATQRLFAALAEAPYRHDFYAVLRKLEALHPRLPRLGRALRPRDEPVRVGQEPDLDFAPAALTAFQTSPHAPPRIGQRFFGLFGPMGAMPLHLTEYVRERARNFSDPTAARFADVFHHRAALLFYRAWAQGEPTAHADRPWDDDFGRWVGSLMGQGPAAFADRDTVPDTAKRFHAGTLARQVRHAEGLAKILGDYFRVPVRLQSNVGHWLPLRREDRTKLLPSTQPDRRSALGRNAVAGSKVWDRQYRFRLHLGPLSYAEYQRFLPGQPSLDELRDWVRRYVGFGLFYDVQLWLRGDAIPKLTLGERISRTDRSGRLGQTAWLGLSRQAARQPRPDDGAMKLRPENIRTSRQAAATQKH